MLTTTQIDTFKRDGVIAFREFFSPEEIKRSLTLHSASVNKRAEERLAVFGRWGVVAGFRDRPDFSEDMWSCWQFNGTDCDERHADALARARPPGTRN